MGKIIHLSIPGMKCNGCVTAVEHARIESDSPLAVLVGAIKAAGFEATEFSEDDQELLA